MQILLVVIVSMRSVKWMIFISIKMVTIHLFFLYSNILKEDVLM